MEKADIVRRARAIFGPRLRGLFGFGSRVSGQPRLDSDRDVAVWLDGPIRRRDSWLPCMAEFGSAEPVIDPTFITVQSLDDPPSWLLEAVRSGVEVWFDPSGVLASRLVEIRSAIDTGTYQRRLFMGLPYYARAAS